MKLQYTFIFDMDGTLYRFDKGQSTTFTTSQFYTDLKNNAYTYFMNLLGISREEAIQEYERIKTLYNGEISLGVEQEYNSNRYEYFDNTWNLNPKNYIKRDTDLQELLTPLKGRIVLLTGAPKIWTLNVLAYLKITDLFENKIYTGEPTIRKPNPLVFQNITDNLNISPDTVFSIGDQEFSDIIPAKSIGMKTILIGTSTKTCADYKAKTIKQAIYILEKEGFL